MRERKMKPITFNTEMVKAILDGRKTQFRRICNFEIWEEQDGEITSDGCQYNNGYDLVCSVKGWEYPQRPTMRAKYKKDDILWIRESAIVINHSSLQASMECKYLADGFRKQFMIPPRLRQKYGGDFPPYIKNDKGMPNGCIKEMARIFLKVTNVRVERLQDISDEDCIKEGISEVGFYPDEGFPLCSGYMIGKDDGKTALANNPQKPFGELWNSTAKDKYKWEDNPYVFVYEFGRVQI